MVEVDGIHKWYGKKHAVNDITFRLGRGEVLAFIGPNGAGKSTSMRVITGFIPATSGRVVIDGHDMEANPLKAKAKLGYLPENAPLYESMSVGGFLGFAAELRGFRGADKRRRVAEAIEKCHLEPVRHQSVDTLSKGYRHRACLAQAIIHSPDFLVLDEPTDGLDPNQKREVRKLIKHMGRDKAIIISTHILEEVESVASRVVLIDRGRKMFDGSPEELRRQGVGSGSIQLKLCSNIEAATAKIMGSGQAAKVEDVTRPGDTPTLRITPKTPESEQDARRAILEMAVAGNWDVVSVESDPGRLDEVFHQLTSDDAKPGDGGVKQGKSEQEKREVA